MAGYIRIYVVGGMGGFTGADGVNPIEFLVLVGAADRQWLEPHYFNRSIVPIGKIRTIVPLKPDHPNSLIDACIAFCPKYFKSCPSLAEVEAALQKADRLDFNARSQEIPAAWAKLRKEAGPQFATMNIWFADLKSIDRR